MKPDRRAARASIARQVADAREVITSLQHDLDRYRLDNAELRKEHNRLLAELAEAQATAKLLTLQLDSAEQRERDQQRVFDKRLRAHQAERAELLEDLERERGRRSSSESEVVCLAEQIEQLEQTVEVLRAHIASTRQGEGVSRRSG